MPPSNALSTSFCTFPVSQIRLWHSLDESFAKDSKPQSFNQWLIFKVQLQPINFPFKTQTLNINVVKTSQFSGFDYFSPNDTFNSTATRMLINFQDFI